MKTLSKLQGYMGRRKALLPVAIVLSALGGLAGLAPFVFIWLIVRELLSGGDIGAQTQVISYAWWAAGTAVGGVVLYFGALMCSHLAAFRVESNIRKSAMRRIVGMPLGFFDSNTTGRIRKIIDDNASITHSFLAHQLPDMAGTALVPLLAVALIAAFDWRLGLACLVPVFTAMGIMAYTMNTRGREFMRQYMNLLEQMNTEAVEYVRGIPVVKVFQQTVYSFKNFYRTIMQYNHTATRYTRLWERPMTLYTVIINSFAYFLVPVAVILTGMGEGVGTVLVNLILFVLVTPVFSECVMKSMYIGQAFAQADEAVRRLDSLTDYPTLKETAEPVQPATYGITFSNVTFAYPGTDTDVLKNVTFTVQQGKRVALVGASGSGKTTIARLVPRFYDVDGGSVRIGGVDVRDISHKELMRTVSFVFQNPQLIKTTILENIVYGRPEATMEEVNRAVDMAQCREIIDRLPDGLNTVIGTEGTYLSGGERQRIALARAFLKDAPVIVLDEATAFADPENEHLMQAALRELTRGKTVITIAHRLTSVADADEILVIDNGRIAERGTHDTLLGMKGIYYNRWNEYCRAVNWTIEKHRQPAKDGKQASTSTAERAQETTSQTANSSAYTAKETSSFLRERSGGAFSFLRRRFALSEKGARDFCRGVAWTTVFDIVLMLPAVFVFMFLDDTLRPLLGGTPSTGHGLAYYALLALAFMAVMYVVGVFQYRSTYTSVYDESANRRISLAEKLRRLPLAFFGEKNLSDLTATIMDDCTDLEHTFSHSVPQLFASLASIALIAVGMAFYCWQLAAALFWVVPVAMGILLLSNRSMRRSNTVNYKNKRAVTEVIQEGLDTIQEIKSYGQESRYTAKLDLAVDYYERVMTRGELMLGVLVNGSQSILKLGLATVVIAGAGLVAAGTVDVFTFLVFLVIGSRVYSPINEVLNNIAALSYLKIRINRMNEMERMPVQEGSDVRINCNYDICFDNVNFSYETGKKVLNDVSFTARQGEITALIGPSGGGKSTAAKLAARFWDVNSGRITLGGVDISTIDPEALLRNFSVVFQDVVLFNASVIDNIRIGRRDATDEEVLRVARLACCDEFVSKLPDGYHTVIGENGQTLSGGERQRISIARALLKDAPVVLLDEATASLDVENETLIQAGISELVKNKTVLIIAHRMRTIANADKILVLGNGKIIEQGTPGELKARGGYFARMLTLQGEKA
jgi:ATP-binding cassette subfamily B protein IrtB